MGSKSKIELMKSYKNIKKEATPKKKQKRKNALDIISKSLQKNINKNHLNGSGGIFINLPVGRQVFKSITMSTLKKSCAVNWKTLDKSQLLRTLKAVKKVARFSLATNDYYKDAKGEKQTETNWHTVVAWGKTAEIIEKYVVKGKEIGITGKT